MKTASVITLLTATRAAAFVRPGTALALSRSAFSRGKALAAVPTPTPTGGPLRMLFGAMSKKSVNYDELKGAAKEAAEAALAGKILTKSADGYDIATFAAGCFWGIELAYQREPGVYGTMVGYTQGQTEKPTYEEVCSGRTGHTEAVQVFYNPSEVSYKRLLELLFSRIDPTQENGQGNDRGTQYRTGAYPCTEEQEAEAKSVFEAEKAKYKRPIATELKSAAIFYPAEAYHQQYLSDGGRFGSQQSAEKGCSDKIRCYG